METLNGGRELELILASGEKETVKVNQLSLRQYEAGFRLLDDELALAGFVCGKTKEWTYSLSPASYELVHQTVREVNAVGFFVYAERSYQNLAKRLSSVSPETLRIAAERVSKDSPPGLHLRPV